MAKKEIFFDLDSADENGLLKTKVKLNFDSLIKAYSLGVFPWSSDSVSWYFPPLRAVFFLNNYKIPKTIKKLMKNTEYRVSFDEDFDFVINACKDAFRKNQGGYGSWIDDIFIREYSNLHRLGYAHSLEIRIDEDIVGGLYGVCLKKIFYGESMFFIKEGMSKLAFFELADFLYKKGFAFIDCQVPNSYLINTLGVSIIKNSDFTLLLNLYKDDNFPIDSWKDFDMGEFI